MFLSFTDRKGQMLFEVVFFYFVLLKLYGRNFGHSENDSLLKGASVP
jgi:hypothetical protein